MAVPARRREGLETAPDGLRGTLGTLFFRLALIDIPSTRESEPRRLALTGVSS